MKIKTFFIEENANARIGKIATPDTFHYFSLLSASSGAQFDTDFFRGAAGNKDFFS